jgi:hypothetical protein
MGHFKLMNFMVKLAPFHSWKDALLRGHIEKCSECGGRLANREEAKRILVQERDVGDLDRLWPAISQKIHGTRPSLEPNAEMPREATARPRAVWRFAAAGAGFLAAVFLTVALVHFFRSSPVQGGGGTIVGDADQVQIHYVRIGNEPAQTFIFKPHDSDVVIVWAGKNI